MKLQPPGRSRRMRFDRGLLLAFFAIGLALGQAGQNRQAKQGTQSSGPAVVAAPRVASPGSEFTGQAVPKDYKIGAEDILFIEIFREPDYSRTVTVRPDGRISLTLVGDIHAEGLTP